MNEFMAIASQFPTAIFSVALIVVGLFWLLAIVGLVDIDFFDLEIEIDAETDASGLGPLAGLLLKFGLHGVPVTVVISVLVLLSWLFCYFGSAYLLALLPGALLKYLGGAVLIAACLVVAFPITAMSLRPMKDVFRGETAMLNREIVGKQCEVRSLEVTDSFGQGLVDDGGAGLLIDIRCSTANELTKGDLVAVTAYDQTTNTYSVMPEKEFMNL